MHPQCNLDVSMTGRGCIAFGIYANAGSLVEASVSVGFDTAKTTRPTGGNICI
jgi:hypothetical protein